MEIPYQIINLIQKSPFQAQATGRLTLLEITFFSFLSPYFHEFWHSVMCTCLITEVKQQWSELILG